ncbi:HNH endonuclease [Desulfoprunum benzoelyticum]|uniref:Putative restriction endonuclease n=1 Tax=Desulfoprunum benzoelyticum TaxID=1506996 RepID=A0A840V175_9BACT|nr:HNH endonuclease signature motif containing protein [Desulfoprunum benzoelyticum]MBB5349424.1 putative restriction endonuclease [Desulfoprunum benzoelyticum]MBM9531206.1 HNH endonuclease [Desulfoprunum benzoelyticum]
MKFWVGVTDNQWFKFLSELQPEEVNFWQPSATPPFSNAPIGLPFLFKLRRPHNHIAGGGYFVTYSKLPLSLAWEIFGPKNGCSSLAELRNLISPLTANNRNDGEIGCTVLANPFFLTKDEWLAEPPGWAPSIVRGKMYETTEPAGNKIWNDIQLRISTPLDFIESDVIGAEITTELKVKYGAPVTVRPRIGQSSFRLLVTEAYQRRCAITGEKTLVTLEAAHIVPYSGTGEHDVRNGLLLRADFHRLFDVGLVSVTSDLEIRISPRIREEWFNGKIYYRLDHKPLSVVPATPSMRPDPDLLDWHFKNRFQA